VKNIRLHSGTLPITVVIPAFNAEHFIKEAIVSVQAQTARPKEIIVVNDGSTDRTASIAKEMGARVIDQANGGLCAARNAGISAATEPWIALLDADDIWEREKLEYQWEALRLSPDADFVFTDFTDFDSSGLSAKSHLAKAGHYSDLVKREVAPGIMICDGESLRKIFLKGNFILPSTFLCRRDRLFEVGLFDSTLSHVEDRELYLRLLRIAKVAVVERSLLRRRIHGSNWSNDKLKMDMGVATIADLVVAAPEKYYPSAVEYYRKERSNICLNTGRWAEEMARNRIAREYYLRAWRFGGGLRPLALFALNCLPSSIVLLLRETIRRLTHRRTPRQSAAATLNEGNR
jgi:glycosyltransferase involved in cell wall biosynthesis